MGLTIHYRGTLDEMSCVEEFEDTFVRLAFAIGGKPRIYRSFANDNSGRVIRGVLINVAQGVDTLSLLLSPEGHFIPLFEIESAKQAPVEQPPYCFVKTQYGTPLSHVCVVLLLKTIRERFAANLEVIDEGGYWETSDFQALVRQQVFLNETIETFSAKLSQFSLTAEAAEDPEIVAARIERIAMLLTTEPKGASPDSLLNRSDPSSSHESSEGLRDDSSNESWDEPTLEEEVDWFERNRRREDTRQERMLRAIAEAIAKGQDAQAALREAMQAEGLPIPDESDTSDDQPSIDYPPQEFTEAEQFLPKSDWQPEETTPYSREVEKADSRPAHPAVTIAQELLFELTSLPDTSQSINSNTNNFRSIALTGLMDCLGGLVQATSSPTADRSSRALAITQLRRALRGQANARGALLALRGENSIPADEAKFMLEQLDTVLIHIHQLTATAWEEDE